MKNFPLPQKQFVLYCLIGTSGTVLDFAIYGQIGRSRLLDYQAANVISYASGTLLSFILNARYNFRVTDKIPLRLARFVGVALLGWAVSAALLYLFVGVWGFNKYYSKVATLVVIVFLQYNLNRRFSFHKSN